MINRISTATLLLFCMALSASADTRTWTGSGNWSNGANWSGGVVPGATDDVVFDATSVNNATIDASFAGSVASVTIESRYTGAITQNRSLSVAGDFIISGGTWRYSAGTAASLDIGVDMTVNSTIQCQRASATGNGAGRVFTVGGDLAVGSSGKFDAIGLGFAADNGPGKRVGSGGGGGHGGMGGNWNNNTANGGGGTCYGSVTNPASLGSGGQNGAGGGAISLLVAGDAVIDGVIDASGAVISQDRGSGAGGSVFIRAANVSGNGTILAQGGNSTYTPSANAPFATGGGGRIAIYGNTVTLPLDDLNASSRWSGSYGKAGNAGTIFIRTGANPLGTLYVNADNVATSAGNWAKPTTLLGPLVTDFPSGNILIKNQGDLQLPSGGTLQVGGWITNSATLTLNNNSEVILDTTNPASISGNISFYDFACQIPGKTLTFASGKTVTVRHVLTMKGSAGDLLALRSDDGSKWKLKLEDGAAAHEVRHVKASDSDASAGAIVAAYSSVDAGNNVNWAFAEEGETNVWLGASGTSWADTGNWGLARLPVSSDVIVIPATANNPILDYNKTIASLVISNGASLRPAGHNITISGDLDVAGTLQAAGGETVTVKGNIDFSGGTFVNPSTTFALAGAGAQSVTSGALAGFNRLELNNTAGTLTFTDGLRATNIYVNGATVQFNGSVNCAQAFYSQGGTMTFNGALNAPLLENSDGPLVCNSSVNAGSLRNRNADLTFGDNLACEQFRSDGTNTLTFAPGKTATTTSLWLNGTPSKPLRLRSSTPGSRWQLNVTHASGVAYVDVADSDASGGLEIEPVLSADSGNNLNWNFDSTDNWTRWTGAVSTDFMNAGNWDPAATPGPASLLLLDGYFANAPRLLPASTVTVFRVSLGGHQTVTLTADGRLTVIQDFNIWPNGVLTHTASENYRIDITVTNNLFVGGTITAAGKGYAADKGPGKGINGQAAGGHGGEGGYWNHYQANGYGGGACYGSLTKPSTHGSGGKRGAGGGVIRLTINGECMVDGTITADAPDINDSGAGAGGSIWITAGTIHGNGRISAEGGRGGSYNGVGYSHGGGGRIAIELLAGNSFGGLFLTAASKPNASGGSCGAAGTIFLSKANGESTCLINGRGVTTLDTPATVRTVINTNVTDAVVGTIVIQNSAKLHVATQAVLTVRNDWTNSAAFSANPGGTVVFGGGGTSTLIGATTFGGLTCDTPGKRLKLEAGKTFSVSGLLRLRNIELASTAAGTAAKLNLNAANGTQNIRYVTVRDNDASGGQTLLAQPHSFDLGNNLNWEFIPPKGTVLMVQ